MIERNLTNKPIRGLIRSYQLDRNANDSVWTNNGTATNVTYVDSDVWYNQRCGSFNGSSSYINIWTWFDQSTWTICAWIKSSSLTEQYIFTKWNNTAATDNIFFSTWIANNWKLWFYSWGWRFWNINVCNWNLHFVRLTGTNNDWKIYVDWKLDASYSFNPWFHTWWWWTAYIWVRSVPNYPYFNWLIDEVDIYNVVLTEQEIQDLYWHWMRQLNWWSYFGANGLLRGCVWFFDVADWSNTLSEILNWTVVTRTAWTNTTDNIWVTRAITNPNQTWASITYTTWYTFENSWSGWQIVTSPSWLSATWINRTTTLRNVYLFNRTLSADEVTALWQISSKKYLKSNRTTTYDYKKFS